LIGQVLAFFLKSFVHCLPQMIDHQPLFCRFRAVAAIHSGYKLTPRDKNEERKKIIQFFIYESHRIPTKNGPQAPVF